MAKQVVDVAARALKEEHRVESGSSAHRATCPSPATRTSPGSRSATAWSADAVAAGLGADTGEHLARAYGEDAAARAGRRPRATRRSPGG